MSGAGVKPLVHRRYDGHDIVLPDDPTAVLRHRREPGACRAHRRRHRDRLGHDAAGRRQQSRRRRDHDGGGVSDGASEIPHGVVRVAFTPDEEVGRGTKYFDVAVVRRAVRLHHGRRQPRRSRVGELLRRRDDGDILRLQYAPWLREGRMVNAIKVAAAFIDSLPDDRPLTRDHRRPRRIRSPLYDAGRRGSHVGAASSSATSTTSGLKEKEASAGVARRTDGHRGLPERGSSVDRRAVPQHARGTGPAPCGGGPCA